MLRYGKAEKAEKRFRWNSNVKNVKFQEIKLNLCHIQSETLFWRLFVKNVMRKMRFQQTPLPNSFMKHYFWKHLVETICQQLLTSWHFI